MDFAKWLSDFKVAHQKARRGDLRPEERKRYLSDCNDMARAVLANQGISLPPGSQPRSILKAMRVLPIELEVGGITRKLTTVEVSADGFSALTGDAPPLDKPLSFVLTVPGAGPVTGSAMCTQATRQRTGSHRCQFRFDSSVDASARERIEQFVFDDLLENLKT